MVLRSELQNHAPFCEREPASVDALDDDRPVRVCVGCFGYYAG